MHLSARGSYLDTTLNSLNPLTITNKLLGLEDYSNNGLWEMAGIQAWWKSYIHFHSASDFEHVAWTVSVTSWKQKAIA